jgi:hypothetical protein
MTNTTYVSTNTSLQTISTFSLPTEKMIEYIIQVQTPQDIETSVVEIVHDGISIEEYQKSHSLSNTMPIEFYTSIVNNTGVLRCSPRANSSIFNIQKQVTECTLYSENTVSGRRIKTDEGMGVYFTGNANNMTIRQSGNNFFGNSIDYITGSTMGPIVQKEELLADEWIPFNGSTSALQSSYTVFTSSGQPKNCLYQELNVIPNQLYKVSGNAYFVSATVNSKFPNRGMNGEPMVFVGNAPGDTDYTVYYSTDTEEAFEFFFTPTQNPVYLCVGGGQISYELYATNLSARESGPFNTYNQTEGAMFLKWNTISAPGNLLTFVSLEQNNTITIDGTNNIYINNVNCGPQYAVNKMAFNYTANGIQVTLNGNSSFYQSSIPLNNQIKQLTFNTVPEEYAAMSSPISNSTLVELTNV